MEITLLAKTPEKESYQIDGMTFHFEYAIGKVETSEERDSLVEKYGCREVWSFTTTFICMKRRVDTLKEEITNHDWDYYWFVGSFNEALVSFGDSAYYSAESLHISHREAITRIIRINELSNELKELETRIEPKHYNFTAKKYESNLQHDYMEMFYQELKNRKLFKKWQQNKVTVDVLKPIKEKISEMYQQDLANITIRIDSVKKELDSLNSQNK